MTKVVSLVLNDFTRDNRVLKTNLSLLQNGYDVSVIALQKGNLPEQEVIGGIKVHRIKLSASAIPVKAVKHAFQYIDFARKAMLLLRNADIIHCNDLNTLPVSVRAKKLSGKRIKLIYDTHELATDRSGVTGWERFLSKPVERKLIKSADVVITVSDSIADWYQKKYSIRKPKVILNCPPLRAPVPSNYLREKFSIPGHKKIFLYQGFFGKGRGIGLVLSAFKDLQAEAVVVFIGYGPLQQKIEEHSSHHSNIFFHTAVNPDMLHQISASADVGVVLIENRSLSYYLALPNKLFESIMASLPVLVSPGQDLKRMVEENQIGWVLEEMSVEFLKKKIAEIISVSKENFSDQLKKVASVYNWEVQEQKLLSFYHWLAPAKQ